MRNTFELGVIEYFVWFSIGLIIVIISGFQDSQYGSVLSFFWFLSWFIIGPIFAYIGVLTRPILRKKERETEAVNKRLADLESRIKELELRRKKPIENIKRKAEKKKWGCPLCQYQHKTKRGLAQHFAMKRNKKHTEWRKKHNLPTDRITMKDVQKMIPLILEIIQKEPEKYS